MFNIERQMPLLQIEVERQIIIKYLHYIIMSQQAVLWWRGDELWMECEGGSSLTLGDFQHHNSFKLDEWEIRKKPTPPPPCCLSYTPAFL